MIVLVIIVGAYVFLVGDKKEETSLLVKNSAASDVQSSVETTSQLAEVREIVSILNQLKTITIDDAIFKDPAFISLTDFHREISPQPKGRPNPFLPGEGVRVISSGQSGR